MRGLRRRSNSCRSPRRPSSSRWSRAPCTSSSAIFAGGAGGRGAGAARAADHRRRLRHGLARRAAAQRLRRRLPDQGRRSRCWSSGRRCRSSPAGSTNSCPRASARRSAPCRWPEPWPATTAQRNRHRSTGARAREKGQVARAAPTSAARVVLRRGPGGGQHDRAGDRAGRPRAAGHLRARSPDPASPRPRGRAERADATSCSRRSCSTVVPIAAVCVAAALVVDVPQVGFRPSPSALRPDFKRINPVSGLRNLSGRTSSSKPARRSRRSLSSARSPRWRCCPA